MRLHSLLLVFLFACSDDPEPFVQRITEISAFDVGNEGNSSDIRVTFSVEIIANINEFRIFVIPFAQSESFDKKQALRLSPESFTSTTSVTTDPDYSVRLSNILDVDGNAIVNDKEYVVKILAVGDKFNQISVIESNKLVLTEQGIYSGYYLLRICYRWVRLDAVQEGPIRFAVGNDGQCESYHVQLSSTGTFYFGNTEEGGSVVSFTAEEDIITEMSIKGGSIHAFHCSPPSSGIVERDLVLVINVPEECSIPWIENEQDGWDIWFVENVFTLRRIISKDV